MSQNLVQAGQRFDAVERAVEEVLLPMSAPGIDLSPLIDALVQFLLQLLEDCPQRDIRRACENAKRPFIRLFWRSNLNRRLPRDVVRQFPGIADTLLEKGGAMTDQDWAAVS